MRWHPLKPLDQWPTWLLVVWTALCVGGGYTDVAEGLTAWHWFLLFAVTVFVVNATIELAKRFRT